MSNGMNASRGGTLEPIGGGESSVIVPDPTGPSPISNDGSTVSTSNATGSSGDANKASISGGNSEANIEKMFNDFAQTMNPPKKTSEKLQDGLRFVQSAIPNDAATVGGDAVKFKE